MKSILDTFSHNHTFIYTPSQHFHTSHSHTPFLQVAAGEEEEAEASTAGEKEETDYEAPPPPVPQKEGPLNKEQSNISAAAFIEMILLLP